MKKYKSTFIKNIYYMLCYAFASLDRKDFENIATERFDDIHNLFAAILAKGISSQIKHGLYKQYIDYSENVSIIRGKINMPETIRNSVNRRTQIACDYDVMSENNIFNQILKTTAKILLCSNDVNKEYKTELKRCILYFSDIDEISPKAIPWGKIQFQRNNNSYRMLLGICQLILDGMLLTDDEGNQRLASFIDNQQTHRLYEKFILEYYRKKYPQLHPSPSQIKWVLDDGERALLPTMQSDIMLSQGNNVLIIDAKFYAHITQKKYEVNSLRSGHIFQIFAYVKNKDAEFKGRDHAVSGILLYAATEEGVQPDVSYVMSGNRISAKTLDLNCEFKQISKKLNRIIEETFNISYGSVKENVEYLKKCGKWADTNKAETNLPDTFEEYGEIPAERNEDYPEMLEIIDDIEAGKSTSEIVKSHPNLALRTAKINELRETLRTDTYSEKKRKLDVIYVYSAVDVELIDYVYNRHSAKDICRMTNYGKNGVTNFDCYRGQKIIVFDSFNSSIPIEAMNVYLSDYPCELPARYTNRAAAYETVYILSFIPLERQYSAMSENDVMLKHFRSKVKKIIEFTENGEVKERDPHG